MRDGRKIQSPLLPPARPFSPFSFFLFVFSVVLEMEMEMELKSVCMRSNRGRQDPSIHKAFLPKAHC